MHKLLRQDAKESYLQATEGNKAGSHRRKNSSHVDGQAVVKIRTDRSDSSLRRHQYSPRSEFMAVIKSSSSQPLALPLLNLPTRTTAFNVHVGNNSYRLQPGEQVVIAVNLDQAAASTSTTQLQGGIPRTSRSM